MMLPLESGGKKRLIYCKINFMLKLHVILEDVKIPNYGKKNNGDWKILVRY